MICLCVCAFVSEQVSFNSSSNSCAWCGEMKNKNRSVAVWWCRRPATVACWPPEYHWNYNTTPHKNNWWKINIRLSYACMHCAHIGCPFAGPLSVFNLFISRMAVAKIRTILWQKYLFIFRFIQCIKPYIEIDLIKIGAMFAGCMNSGYHHWELCEFYARFGQFKFD